MGRAIPCVVGDREFRTKEKLTEYVQSILHGYELGDDLDKHDFDFIYTLLVDGHHDPERKIGCGVADIFVKSTGYGYGKSGRGFFIRRQDGSEVDFSYKKCITPVGPLHNFKVACRNAARPDILKFKEDYFRDNADEYGLVTCPLTQQKVPKNECDVHHEPPNTFDKIVLGWISELGINPEDVELSGYEDGSVTKNFVEDYIAQSFRIYHQAHMNLTITAPEGHRRQKRSEGKDKPLKPNTSPGLDAWFT